MPSENPEAIFEPKEEYLNFLDRALAGDDSALLTYLKGHHFDKDFHQLLDYTCGLLLDLIVKSCYFYTQEFLNTDPTVRLFCKLVRTYPDSVSSNSLIFANFFRHNHTAVLNRLPDFISEWCERNEKPISADVFCFHFLSVFKNGFSGLWDKLTIIMSEYPTEPLVLELCKSAPLLFSDVQSATIEQELNRLLQMDPNSLALKELLVIAHYTNKQWGNSVAFAEQIDEPMFVFKDELFFNMAWCYGKLRETEHEIEAYEKCLSEWENHPFALNNLGYAYYKNRQYKKALSVFDDCLKKEIDTSYAANNYVRTLLAMKCFSDAKQFIQSGKFKVAKKLSEKAMNAENINLDEDNDTLEDTSVSQRPPRNGIIPEQFSNERILEDELVERMNAGHTTFGKKLKILRRKGIYGRQYILSNGRRPDLLAEDEEGSLYIIELKKDSGYDDAYEQIVDYLNWFDTNWPENPKCIHGIICLNNPSNSLLKKVHSNLRVELYEYHISYTKR